MSCNSRSISLQIFQQRLRLFIASMILVSVGCLKGSDSPPNDNAVEKGPVAVPADVKQNVAKAIPPQWPPLPESGYAATQQEFLASLHSRLRNVRLTPPSMTDIVFDIKDHVGRVRYYSQIVTDVLEFEFSIDESCAVSFASLCEQFSQMMSEEEALQNQRLTLLNGRLDWYSKYSPDAPEVVEFKEILRTTQAALQSPQKSKQLLAGGNCQSVKMAQDFMLTLAPIKKEYPVLHDAFAACLAPFQSALDSTNKLKPELVEWVSGSINTELTALVAAQTDLEPQLALEELRLKTLQQVRDNKREEFSGSDEEWNAFKALLSELKNMYRGKISKMPKVAFDTCMASKLFEKLSAEVAATATKNGGASEIVPLSNEQFQAVVRDRTPQPL